MTGKILKGIAGFYYVHDGHSAVYECKAKGIFRNKKIRPLVGDNVDFTVLDERDKEGNIEEILPRKNALVRPAVANVDQALVLFSVTHPAPNLNLLDRFLVMMERQRVPAAICFNKIDLTKQDESDRYGKIYERAGYAVYYLSASSGEGLDEIRKYTAGRTTVLAGPSGVGKSTVTNLLEPEAHMETGGISEKIQRGKHTTRHSELFCIADNTYMMDTPGFSSMYVESLEEGELKNCFPEFAKWEAECRFLGCAHIGEPDCGVKDAVLRGDLSRSRYENYKLMYQELKDRRRY